MDQTRTFELKVGIFILISIAFLFIMVFSIGDIYLVKPGYHIKVIFNFCAGIGPSAPVRLAGVGIGHVEGIRVFYDEKDKCSKAELSAWIKEHVKIEKDADFTINTLGLLGEKYLEIFPGKSSTEFIKGGEVMVGRDPVSMEKITDNLVKLTDSVTVIIERLRKGEGTIGKFLTEDKIYKDMEAFVEDIKRNPWKLLSRPR